MSDTIRIGKNCIGRSRKTYCIAEVSANHNQKFDEAVSIIHAAKAAGADAIKLQTYTPDTLTIQCENEFFQIRKGTIWEGKNLYQLYAEAYTPWEWQRDLKNLANDLGMDFFSTPFDRTAVDFLESIDVPAYKVASFELVDIPLIRRIAQTGKPVIMSTGMASLNEIKEAVNTVYNEGNEQIALLKCTSAYPAPVEEMNLRTILDLIKKFKVPVGLSDHTLGSIIPVTAIALGACIIEKHFTLSRATPGPDCVFSLEPIEFKEMVSAVRNAELSLGKISYGLQEHEKPSAVFRRSLFVVNDIKKGEQFTVENIRSIRPGFGLKPKYFDQVLQCRAAMDLPRGTPLTWSAIQRSIRSNDNPE